jgi:hypothetical protein
MWSLFAGLAAAGVTLWSLAVVTLIVNAPRGVPNLLGMAGVMFTLLAALVIAVHVRRERDTTMLLKALVDVNRPAVPVQAGAPLLQVVQVV